MSEGTEAVVKVCAAVVALAGLWLLYRSGWAARTVSRTRLQWLLVALGAFGYVNYGGFHTDGTPFHLWDQFHYVIGSKYFPELGYDGIYAALAAARRDDSAGTSLPPLIRDLRTSKIVSVESLTPFIDEVRGRFSDARWQSFRSDALNFRITDELLLDHGYNPTPARTAVERLFTAFLPFRTRTLALYAAIDFLLLALAGFVIHRVFGLEALVGAALIFGLGYCSRYYWVGGAFLRQDWLVALVISAAALARGRMRMSGAALGYAAWTRVFPILIVLPLAVFAISTWQRAGTRTAARHVLEGLAVASLVLVVAGSLTGRGTGAWLESFNRLRVHTGAVGPNAIGLKVPFSMSLSNLRGDLVNPNTFYDYERIAIDVAATGRRNSALISLAVAALLGFAGVVVWTSRDPMVAFVAGIGVIYAITTPSCYYGSFFALLALVRPVRTTATFLAATIVMYGTAGLALLLSRTGVITLNGAAIYAPVSILLLLVFISWLLDVRGRFPRGAQPAMQPPIQ